MGYVLRDKDGQFYRGEVKRVLNTFLPPIVTCVRTHEVHLAKMYTSRIVSFNEAKALNRKYKLDLESVGVAHE